MVSSGQVNSDSSSLKTLFTQYDGYISELSSCWTGASHDNLAAKASEFSSSYLSSLQSQMTSFASACDLYEDYKKAALKSPRLAEGATINFDKFINEQGSKYCLTGKDYEEYEKYIDNFIKDGTTARLGNIAGLILALAMAGEIDERYMDEVEAAKAAVFLQNSTSYCLKDNYNVTGSFITIPVGIPKLLLNGAREYIELVDEDINTEGRVAKNG